MEYEILFRDHPPTSAAAPDLGACRAIARVVRRSPGAVLAQWQDGRSAVLGQPSSASSEFLVQFLRAQGWL
jgi:hypothetical protein